MSSNRRHSSAATWLAGQSAFAVAGYLFTALAGFPFQIYVARHLGASGLGVYSLVDSGVQILAGLLSLGIAQSMMRYVPVYAARDEYRSLRSILIIGGGLMVGVGLAGYAVMCWLFPMAYAWWPELVGAHDLALVLGLTLPLSMLLLFLSQTLRGFYDVRHVVLGNSFLQLTTKIACASVFFSLGWKELGLAWSVVIATSGATLWMALGLRRHWSRVRPQRHEALPVRPPKEWLDFAKIMYMGSLLGVVAGPVDKFLLGAYEGVEVVGVFAVVMTLISITGVVLQLMVTVVTPLFAEVHGSGLGDARLQELFQLCTDWIVRITFPLICFLALFAESMLNLFGPGFASLGAVPLWIVLAGQTVNVVSGPIGKVLEMTGHEKVMLKFNLFEVALGILALLLLVPMAGLAGAALAIGGVTVLSNFIALWVGRTRAKLRWYGRRYRRWVIPAMVTIVVGLWIRFGFGQLGPWALLATFALVCSVFHATYLVHGMTPEDREIWVMLKQKLGIDAAS